MHVSTFLLERIMSCFSCCEEDELHKASESGGQYVVKNSTGNLSPIGLTSVCVRERGREARRRGVGRESKL